jgi:hypothetical protein
MISTVSFNVPNECACCGRAGVVLRRVLDLPRFLVVRELSRRSVR